jgi:hypothetical protein
MAKVGLHIVNECLLGLLKNKTRLLVTHNINILPHADVIAVMERGTLRAFGSHAKLIDSGIDFNKIIPPNDGKKETKESKKDDKKSSGAGSSAAAGGGGDKKKDVPLIPPTKKIFTFNYKNAFGGVDEEERAAHLRNYNDTSLRIDNYTSLPSNAPTKDSSNNKGEKAGLLASSTGATATATATTAATSPIASSLSSPTAKKGGLTEEEGRQAGSVSYEVYKSYFSAAGGQFVAIFVLFTMSLTMVANIATSNWLAYWSNHSVGQDEDIAYYLGGLVSRCSNRIFLHPNC